jgi:hypothetical protein
MKEVKVSFETSITLRQTDIHWIEEELLRIREEVFKEVLKKVINQIEKEELQGQQRCERCGEQLVGNGRDRKKIKTLLGEIQTKRARMRCKRCKEDIYPLDKALGIEDGERITLGVKERALWAAVEVSYEKASGFLKKFNGLGVSRKKIHTAALEEGKRIQHWEEMRRKRVFEKGEGAEEAPEKTPEVLYIQVDGTGVNNRDSSKEWMECKVGTSFSERVLVSKDRVWLMDKKSYASIESADAFGEKFFLESVKQGVLRAKTVYFIGDGARWIRNVKEDYFPGAIGVLDIWHLEREFKKALGKDKEATVGYLKGLALQGKGRQLLKLLNKEKLSVCEADEKKKIEEVIGYVWNNLSWIENIPKVGGYGSGPVEKTVDITVARRFKKRGMSWYKGGANPLLRLRLLKLNGEWDIYWHERRKKLARHAA